MAGRRLGHFPTMGEWHVIRNNRRRSYVCGLGGEGVDREGGRGGMGADVMRSEGAAHASIRTGLTGKRAGLATATTGPQMERHTTAGSIGLVQTRAKKTKAVKLGAKDGFITSIPLARPLEMTQVMTSNDFRNYDSH